MIVKLLTERHLEFLSLKGECRGSSESTLVKMSNCWKSHALAQLLGMVVPYVVLKIKQLMIRSSLNLLRCFCGWVRLMSNHFA